MTASSILNWVDIHLDLLYKRPVTMTIIIISSWHYIDSFDGHLNELLWFIFKFVHPRSIFCCIRYGQVRQRVVYSFLFFSFHFSFFLVAASRHDDARQDKSSRRSMDERRQQVNHNAHCVWRARQRLVTHQRNDKGKNRRDIRALFWKKRPSLLLLNLSNVQPRSIVMLADYHSARS